MRHGRRRPRSHIVLAQHAPSPSLGVVSPSAFSSAICYVHLVL